MRTLVSRGLRVAAAGALVAVWAGVGSGTSGAVTTLIECDKVVASVLADDGSGAGIGGTVKDITAKVKGLGTGQVYGPAGGGGDTLSELDKITGDNNPDISSFKAGNSAPCTNVLTLPSSLGNLAKLAGKLTGRVTCDATSTDPTQYPLNGKLVLTYTGINPATTKNWNSITYVRTQASSASSPFVDQRAIHGIVTKGVAPGADVDAEFLFQPSVADLGDAQSACVPGGGPGTLESLLVVTDGNTYAVLNDPGCLLQFGAGSCALDDSIRISLPS